MSRRSKLQAETRDRIVDEAIGADWRSRRFRKRSRLLAEAVLRRWPDDNPHAINAEAFARQSVEDVRPERSAVANWLYMMLARIVVRQLWKLFERWIDSRLELDFRLAVQASKGEGAKRAKAK